MGSVADIDKPPRTSRIEKPSVLFVDDEPLVLSGIRRLVHNEFTTHFAASGDEGIALLKECEGVMVIVSDMRMPGMDGVTFLSEARVIAPDAIRVMLTGYADMSAAKRAVNEGRIFRFLTKPTEPEELLSTLRTCVAQYRVGLAERDLLENTLAGSIGLLTDVLSMTNPAAFSRGSRIRQYARHIAAALKLSDPWQFQVAGMLSEIGCVTLPPDLVQAVHAGQSLTPQDMERYTSHPKIGYDLICQIPRLEPVASMILLQREPAKSLNGGAETLSEVIQIGAQILHVGLAFDQLLAAGFSRKEAIESLASESGDYRGDVVEALKSFIPTWQSTEPRQVDVKDLRAGMVLKEDLRTVNGSLLGSKGQDLSLVLMTTLRNFIAKGALTGTVRVSVDVGEEWLAQAETR